MLRFHTFGNLTVHGPGGPLSGSAAQPRRLAVLVLIARSGARGAARARVVSMLWPDADDAQGRRAVAQALYALRRDLGSDDAILGTHDLRVNADVVWCDVREFHDALDRGDLSHAVSMYAGPFLDGFRLASAPEFERWADDERLAIQHRYHEALERLATAAESRHAFDEAARWWRRRAVADPLNSRVAIAIMNALAASGDRAGALAHAELFEALFAEELSLPADQDVVRLAASLRQGVRDGPGALSMHMPVADAPCTVAVLPFAAIGGHHHTSAATAWGDGLAEEVITEALGASVFRVIGRSASFALGPNGSLGALRALGADYAIEGSVRPAGGGWRVTARILDVRDGRVVWCERSDHANDDPVAAHESIASRIIAAASRQSAHRGVGDGAR